MAKQGGLGISKNVGEKNPRARLDPDRVRAIRAEKLEGSTEAELGVKYGVDPSAIHQCVRRKTWKHV